MLYSVCPNLSTRGKLQTSFPRAGLQHPEGHPFPEHVLQRYPCRKTENSDWHLTKMRVVSQQLNVYQLNMNEDSHTHTNECVDFSC